MAIDEKKKEAIKGILKVWKAYSPNGDRVFDLKGDTLLTIDSQNYTKQYTDYPPVLQLL